MSFPITAEAVTRGRPNSNVLKVQHSDMTRHFKKFLQLEASGGIVLVLAAFLAMLVANSPLVRYYDLFIDLPVEVRLGPLHLAKPLLLWINDGMMAIFFFLIGLELKREFLDGDLADPRNITLPALGALGGMAIPSLIYVALKSGRFPLPAGWAIPGGYGHCLCPWILTLLGEKSTGQPKGYSGFPGHLRTDLGRHHYYWPLFLQGKGAPQQARPLFHQALGPWP